MKKKLIGTGITLVFLAISLSGCTEELTEKEYVTVDAPLNTLGLSLKNMSKGFVKSGEVYNVTPYVVDEGILNNTKVLERYNATFKESEYNILDQALVRCESKDACITVYNRVKTGMSAVYPEISGFIIGDESYVGGKTVAYLGTNYSSYILTFRIADVLVLLSGVTPGQIDFREYGYIIEDNINEHLD